MSESAGSSPSPAPEAARPDQKFFVVGVGGSAGALDAFSELLKHIPRDANLALLIAQHLSARHESLLMELLGRISPLRVQWAAHGQLIEAGNVYVLPPGKRLLVRQGALILEEPDGSRPNLAVDTLFRSLADDLKHRAVGVVLSGNGTDGTHGLKAIKAAAGLTFAQRESTASFAGMPHAAIHAGIVDRALPPHEIAAELVKLAQHAPTVWHDLAANDEAPPRVQPEALAMVFRLLAARTGVDFSDYKQSTIKRRVVRRMVLAKAALLPDYVNLLQKDRGELDALYESLLINVTEFFRDPESFDFLREQVLPGILDRHADSADVRIWVPGCATGEEAYSLGILVREMMEERGRIIPVHIFATDISEPALALARAGLYGAGEVANLSPERLRRFFFETERGYVIQKPIRDLCIFARQNVVKDSPFSRLDLISCRNLLIYLGPKLQRKLMPLFHYALSPHGFLALGSSESVGGSSDLFRLIDRRFRVYTRKSSTRRVNIEFSVDHVTAETGAAFKAPPAMADETRESYDVIREADRIVLSRHGPTGVLINDEFEILQFRGDVSPYLTLPPGRASLNVVKMAREDFAAELEPVLREAREKNVRVHKAGITVLHESKAQRIDIDVTPIDAMHTKERCYLVLFGPATGDTPARPPLSKTRKKKKGDLAQIEQLTHDLQATRSYLQSTIEKHEATNQELRAANEEIQSSNEELQSTNEELETAKEELQSTNEELTTVNEELHSRQLELMQVNNDLNNLINSVHLPIIILGQDMRIRRFTPMAEKVLNLIPTDIGRPLSDININLQIGNLPQLVAEVVDSLTLKELEVQDSAGRWYSIRLRPYKTAENKIDGVVLTLIDIDPMKRTIGELEETRNIAQAIVEMMREPLAALSDRFHIRVANEAFYRLFSATREQMQGRSIFEFVKSVGDGPDVRQALDQILPLKADLTDFKVRLEIPGVPGKETHIHARQIVGGHRAYPLILVSFP